MKDYNKLSESEQKALRDKCIDSLDLPDDFKKFVKELEEGSSYTF